jgi:hypothetical protein
MKMKTEEEGRDDLPAALTQEKDQDQASLRDPVLVVQLAQLVLAWAFVELFIASSYF